MFESANDPECAIPFPCPRKSFFDLYLLWGIFSAAPIASALFHLPRAGGFGMWLFFQNNSKTRNWRAEVIRLPPRSWPSL